MGYVYHIHTDLQNKGYSFKGTFELVSLYYSFHELHINSFVEHDYNYVQTQQGHTIASLNEMTMGQIYFSFKVEEISSGFWDYSMLNFKNQSK